MRAGYLRAWSTGGDAFFERGEFARAAELYRNARDLVPHHEDFHLRLGVSLVQLGRFDEAEKAFEELVRRDPRSFQGWFNLGNVRDDTGRPIEARQAWRKALSINPAFRLARQALARSEGQKSR